MWTCDAEGVLHSQRLSEFPWLWHGFGTRLSDGWPGQYASLKQTHSDTVYVIDKDGACAGEGDALVTAVPGVRIGVRTADCVPVLIADPNTRAVAAVHAGWRGTISEVTRKAVETMQRTFDSPPANLHAAIGPCIAECCFEVGSEVASEFRNWFPDWNTRTHIDLVSVNVRQLQQAGIPEDQIDVAGLCTVCDAAGRFHSFRRDKDRSGRMVAAIGIHERP
jgi:polyphenol oxidase